MARLKAEAFYHYHRQHGLPWRNRVFGHVANLARWGCRLAPISNWAMRGRFVRRLGEAILGIDRRRMPPAFAGRTLAERLAPFLAARLPDESPPGILLIPDTFANYYEPDVGEAAISLFRRADCRVVLGPRSVRCCGRPLISNGLLNRAALAAEHNVNCLVAWADRGWKIVACEPSCLLTIRDDYPALLKGEDRSRAEAVARSCLTFEEALDSLLAEAGGNGDGPPRLGFVKGPRRVLVQGHCHQRCLVGMAPMLRLLRRIPGAEVVDLDAGCCGMAGSFGYEVEHYEISRLVGEQRLFPALREDGPESVVVAPGFSCRLQIGHFTGRSALHTAQILASLGNDA
jgi:Fe-S oxidoreductase